MIIEGNDTTIRIWFCARSEDIEAIEHDIVVDYDGMDRIVGGEVLNPGSGGMADIHVAGIAKYDADLDILSFWLLDDPDSVRQDVLSGKLLFSNGAIVGIEVPTTAFVSAATLQLFRDRR